MSKDLWTRVLVILAVIATAVVCTLPVKIPFIAPAEKRINLGLDLQGGMHIILQVEVEKLDDNSKSDAVLRAIEITRNRLDPRGDKEIVIQPQGDNQILVQIPGVSSREERDEYIDLMKQIAKLEFKLVSNNPQKIKAALEGNVPQGYELKTIIKENNEPVLLESKTLLTGEYISDARMDRDPNSFNQPYISLKFKSEGAKKFASITRNNIDRRLAIILDGEVISAPNIQNAIAGGNAQITGQFTPKEASLLARALRSGSLPVPMHIEEERTIGPLLGQDSIDAGINATVIGGLLVFAFMLIYYLTAGFVSSISLAINLLLIFGSMGFIGLTSSYLTLTLPGIAGIILTLGMAVDANVLINERIREELSNDRPLLASINNGFNKALKAIVDSNVTTLIAAFMLFQFGSGPIKGFAVTLSLGLLCSLFSAMYITKTIFHVLLNFKIIKKLPMLQLLSNTKIDFVSKRYVCFVLSGLLVIGSIGALIYKKDTAYGIDFVGGQIQEYKFTDPINPDELRTALKDIDLEDAVIQQFKQAPGNVLIRTSEDTYDKVFPLLQSTYTNNPFEVLRIEKVGPVVGEALKWAAILAIIFALGGILIFVGFRFKHFDFATAGVIALLHDVFVTLGLLIIMGRQVDLLVVTALLTIAGYSINDTIIIYDRVRENMQKSGKHNLKDIINLSINQTLGRTILTTITTLIVVVTLYFKGGEILNTFALCLLIGFVLGTYSTIFIASPLVLAWEKKNPKSK